MGRKNPTTKPGELRSFYTGADTGPCETHSWHGQWWCLRHKSGRSQRSGSQYSLRRRPCLVAPGSESPQRSRERHLNTANVFGREKARRASQTGADVASFAPRRIVTFLAGPQKIIDGLLVSNLIFSEVVRRGTTHCSYGKSPKESLVAGATLSELHRSASKLQQLSEPSSRGISGSSPGTR
jgi:hypothetical protein